MITTLANAKILRLDQFAYDAVDGDGDPVCVYGVKIVVQDLSGVSDADGPTNAVIIPVPAIAGMFGPDNLIAFPGMGIVMDDILQAAMNSGSSYVQVTRDREVGPIRGTNAVPALTGTGERLESALKEQVPSLADFVGDGILWKRIHEANRDQGTSAIVLPFGGAGEQVTLVAMCWYRPEESAALFVPHCPGAKTRTAVGSVRAAEHVGETVGYTAFPPFDDNERFTFPEKVFMIAKGTDDRSLSLHHVRQGFDGSLKTGRRDLVAHAPVARRDP